MATAVDTDYQSGVVISQLPSSGVEVPPGSAAHLLVAVTPSATVVPNVSMDSTLVAQYKLRQAMLTPVVYEQLSDSVDFGRIVGQMPRAGEPVMTGQPVVVFVSLGRGSSGAVVPDVVGKSLRDASTDVLEVYLLTQVYTVYEGMSMDDIVVDQLPAPGSRVPVGSPVGVRTTPATK